MWAAAHVQRSEGTCGPNPLSQGQAQRARDCLLSRKEIPRVAELVENVLFAQELATPAPAPGRVGAGLDFNANVRRGLTAS